MSVICNNVKTCGVLSEVVAHKKGEAVEIPCEHAAEHERTGLCNNTTCLRICPKPSQCEEVVKEAPQEEKKEAA